MSRAAKRTERLRELERRYLLGAWTDEELAERMGVGSRATIYKDRQLLENEGVPFIEVERGRWKIDRSKYISTLRVTLHQSVMLWLMARRTARQVRHPNPHVTTVLKNVALMLRQPMMERLLKSADFIPTPTSDNDTMRILEKVILCWVEGRKIRIRYQALNAGSPVIHLVSPWLLEPSLTDEGIYLIGYSETMERAVPFKLSRIISAADTSQPVRPPDSFDEERLVREAWGIWSADNEPTTVRLCLRGREAVRRIQETVWHPDQQIEVVSEAECFWSARVSEWREMVPWVRGWGSQAEVLEPQEMRETLMGEARAMAERYGWFVSREAGRTRSAAADFFG